MGIVRFCSKSKGCVIVLKTFRQTVEFINSTVKKVRVDPQVLHSVHIRQQYIVVIPQRHHIPCTIHDASIHDTGHQTIFTQSLIGIVVFADIRKNTVIHLFGNACKERLHKIRRGDFSFRIGQLISGHQIKVRTTTAHNFRTDLFQISGTGLLALGQNIHLNSHIGIDFLELLDHHLRLCVHTAGSGLLRHQPQLQRFSIIFLPATSTQQY